MVFRHREKRRLLAHAEGHLAAEEARQVDTHVESCRRCQAYLETLRLGVDAMARLEPARIPRETADRIRRVLDEPDLARPEAPRHHWLAVAASILLLMAAGLVGWSWLRSDVRIRTAPELMSELESHALSEHRAFLEGTLVLEVEGESVAEVRRWAREAGFYPALVTRPGGIESGRFRIRGARRTQVGDVEALSVFYRIGREPVTLLMANARNLAGAPPKGILQKSLFFRSESSTRQRIITWTSGGDSYALVSLLPGMGQEACLICHDDQERRRRIQQLSPPD